MTKNLGIALDIDDTIADTSRYCIGLLHKKWGHAGLQSHELLQKYGYAHLIPEWQLPQNQAEINSMMHDQDLYSHYEPLPGVLEKLSELTQLVPVSCYITSRFHWLQATTQKWLNDYNFPRAPLICRPEHITAPDWKVRYLVENDYQILGLIDNELYVPLDVKFDFKLWELIQYVKISPPHPALIECKNWDQVIQEITKTLNHSQ